MEGNTPIDFDLRSGSTEIQAPVTAEKNDEVYQEPVTSLTTLLTKEKHAEKADTSAATKKKRGRPKKKKIEGLPKLDDANEAGGPRSSQCTLILTEGDSAKTLAVSGLSVVGRDLYGVYPLRGKPLNVRDANLSMVQKNEELMAIVKIMNLEFGKEYDDVSGLRYGHLMIMADQDHDGSHIKGLIINFIHFFWPSLLKIPGFLLEFVTPIVRAKKDNEVVSFYSTNEYKVWKEKNDTTGWAFKYYKGLGTSTFSEAKQYFSALDKHIKEFVYDGAADDYAIDLAFSRRKADERRIWLSEYEEGTGLDELLSKIPFSEFINKELIQFSLADCKRCIPSIMDGLKPGQRKVLYGCFKRDLTSSLRVAQLAGYIAETALYHHGECSLQSTIVGMAQTFVGSNNINLLEPEGQFGTRLHGGKDSASPRYIYTKLSPLTRKLFHPADDKLVKYIEEEGTSIEPEWYIPIIPMVLVNGTAGIGTGWSSVVPNYNPRDIVENIRRMMKNEPLQQMTPWYRGFKGTIQWNPAKNCFVSQAVWRRVDDETLEITELVVQYWTSSFKEYLDKASSPSSEVVVKSVVDNSTDTVVNFTVIIPGLKDISDDQLVKDLRLETKITTSNMHLYDAEGKIKKYDTPEQIIEEFYPVRLKFYEQRKAALVADQIAYLQRLENKLKYLELVGDGKLKVYRRNRADVLSDMAQLGLDPMVDENGSDRSTPSYEYLLSIPINALTLEDIQALEAEYQRRRADLAKVCDTTPEQFWEADLKLFLDALEEYERDLDKPKTKKKQRDIRS